MSLIPEVKCSRCDRMYPGLRARCPYCGARRSEKGKRAADESSLWKMIIGIALLAILLIAIIVLIATSAREHREEAAAASASAAAAEAAANATPTIRVTMPPADSPSPTTAVISVETLQLRYGGEEIDRVEGDVDYRYDVTIGKTEELPVTAYVVPETAAASVTWTSGDTKVFTVEVDENDPLSAVIRAEGEGEAYLTISVDNSNAFIRALIRVG